MKRRQHNAGGSGVIIVFLYLLALAAAITKSHAWIMIRPQQQQQQRYSSSSSCATIITSSKSTNINRGGRGRELYRSTTSRSWQKCETEHTPTTTTTRLYSSGSNGNNNNNNNGDGDDNNNFFSKAINAVKSFLPNQLFDGSESSSSGNENEKESNNKKQDSQIEQQQQQQQQTEMTNEFSGSLKEILKDAPLGVRMMGEIISPIIGGLLSTVGGIVAEQQRTIEDVMEDAKIYMQLDQSVTDMLGTTTISLGSPTSQSSSTSIINGNAQSRIELTIPVYSGSSYSTSTVQVLAINNVITQMELNDNGRRISVSLASQSPTYSTDTSYISSSSSSSSSSSKTMRRDNDDDMIIEAEIIDKQTKQ